MNESAARMPESAPRYWVGVASREHVLRGIAGGFAQLCHGKEHPLRRMRPGDWIVYYSPRETFGGKDHCRRFTALGEVTGEAVYQVEMGPGFVPFRRDVRFLPTGEASIVRLLDRLSFIRDRQRWGYVFRYGHLQIPEADFRRIAEAMSAGDRKAVEETVPDQQRGGEK